MKDSRYAPCKILLEESIPSLIWFEDAVARYGVPTVVFDLCLIVPDIQHAADILHQRGWRLKPPGPYSFLTPPCPVQYRRLICPVRENERNQGDAFDSPETGTSLLSERTSTVLLSATEWKIPTERLHEASNNHHLPSLPVLANGLITNLLDAPDGSNVAEHLLMMLGYLYDYSSEVKTEGFENCLNLENRQFHLDCISGQLSLWTLPFARHQRQVREDIRQGHHEFRECSVARTPENRSLFKDDWNELAERLGRSHQTYEEVKAAILQEEYDDDDDEV
ncbi:hypothetical protein F5Y08DRAFT_317788 [Xylaria arbuscula]|nr:hypothetical protein F5Y08DRAFT_317788 [Xylaria arbuscula]